MWVSVISTLFKQMTENCSDFLENADVFRNFTSTGKKMKKVKVDHSTLFSSYPALNYLNISNCFKHQRDELCLKKTKTKNKTINVIISVSLAFIYNMLLTGDKICQL